MPIMPTAARGRHAFRASQQSCGAASNMPALLSKRKGKGKANEQEQGVEADGDGENNSNLNDNPAIILPPSLVPISVIHSSTSTSLSATSSNKCKHSALGDDSSMWTGLPNSGHSGASSSNRRHSGTTVMEGISTGLENISGSIRDLTTEHKACRILQEAHIVAQANKFTAEAWELSPKCRQNAMERLQDTKGHLKPQAMICLIDYIAKDTTVADIYMSLKWEDYHKEWISERLKECGFVNGEVE